MSGQRHGALAAVVLAVSATAALPAQAAENATVSVLHGVPGATVDVYANGKALLKNFKPGTLTDPQSLPSGLYDLKVTAAGAGVGGAAVIQASDVEVPAGANVTVVAHLGADGKPRLTPFANDVSKVAAGKGRLTVRHTAAAPAVDVRAGGKPVFRDLTNPNEAKADLPAGTVSADVVLAGTSTVAIGPAEVNLTEGTSTIVYAWGSAQAKNLKLAVQTIGGLHSDPSGIPGGTGGQAAADDTPAWLAVLLLVGGAGALSTAAGLTVARVRARS
jgi:hypothetical protein